MSDWKPKQKEKKEEGKEDTDYGDDVEFNGKASSFKELTIQHLGRISKLFSCELRGGYYTILKGKDGIEQEIYIPDTREALSNAIFFLALILKCQNDNNMKEAWETFETNLKELKEKFLKYTKMEEEEVLGEAYYNDEEKIKLEEYKIKKMEGYKTLFQELASLLARKRYFEIGGGVF